MQLQLPPSHTHSITHTAQLGANDQYKRLLADPATGDLSVPRRLAGGAAAGMTATALTHPLDVVRLRLALPGHNYNGALLRVLVICSWWVFAAG